MHKYNYPDDRDDIIELMDKTAANAKMVRKHYYDVAMAFDIETTQINTPEYHHAYMYIWQYAIEDNVIFGRTWKDFINFYENLVASFKLGQPMSKAKHAQKYKAICLVHNLAFEFQFICRRLPWAMKKVKGEYYPNIFAKDAHNIVTAVTRQNLEFRCTLNLTGKSLAKLAKDYRLESEKKVGKLDYLKYRNSQTPLSPDEIEYCAFDDIILTEWYRKYFSPVFLHGSGKIPTTKTSIVRGATRCHFDDLKRVGRADYPKGFPETPELYKWLMTWVYRGGYTHTNAAYTAVEFTPETDPEGLDSYDFTSSYPYRMIVDLFPYELIEIPADEIEYYLNEPEKYAVMFEAKFFKIRSKTTHSLESYHKCIDTIEPYIDNGRIASAQMIHVAMTEQDYLSYKDCYEWEEMQIVGSVYVSEKKPLPTYLKDMVCKYYYEKSTIDSIKYPTDYKLAKENLNSLYGMCCSGIFHDSYVWNGYEMEPRDIPQDYEELIKSQILLPQWGVYISAYARRAEVERMMSLTSYSDMSINDAIYGDTDSWKVRHPEKYVPMMERYNDRQQARMDATDLSLSDFSFIGCKDQDDLKEKLHGLGYFKRESHIDYFKALGCKRYIMNEREFKKDGTLADPEVVVKCAGMKSEKFLKKHEGKTREELFNEFHFGTELLPEESGKMAHHYNMYKHSDVIADEYGNTERMTELTSICLYPIPFKMSTFVDYVAFYLELQEDLKRRYREYDSI